MAKKLRRPLIAANWKMNKTFSETEPFLKSLKVEIAPFSGVTAVICPPFTSLPAASKLLENTSILLGAQNMCWSKEGAFTGEISPIMLRDLYVTHVILGHSERRNIFGETDLQIHEKLVSAIGAELTPILCVGESQSERAENRQRTVIEEQLLTAIGDLKEEAVAHVVIAYEPVWAIGTGKTATPKMAQEMHGHIRSVIAENWGNAVAEEMRILYGGSMNAANAESLLSQPDIGGGLIGGASLHSIEFAKIVEIAHRIHTAT
ncbi:MAG: triose-phosphate isomerase [Puniceicoccales bacterium]|jgi:triosephosphate isomerase|nr:triose-phosphate isomerase [Puniceicoccales bacterium]